MITPCAFKYVVEINGLYPGKKKSTLLLGFVFVVIETAVGAPDRMITTQITLWDMIGHRDDARHIVNMLGCVGFKIWRPYSIKVGGCDIHTLLSMHSVHTLYSVLCTVLSRSPRSFR